jgi:acetyl/propionyl-CoA carboxylase alpha subunit
MTSEIYFAEIEGKEYQIEILSESRVVINGSPHEIDIHTLKLGASCSLLFDGKSFEPTAFNENGDWEILLKGRLFNVRVEDEITRRLRLASGSTSQQTGKYVLLSPMPGLVIDIPVEVGAQVKKGEVLIILESMKMQNELRAPREGIITSIQASVNDNVERKETLLILE